MVLTRRVISFAALLLASTVSLGAPALGAAGSSTAPTAPSGVSSFTFWGPADNDPRLEEFACGIRFGMRQVVSNVHGGRSAVLKHTGQSTAQLITFNGDQDFNVGKGYVHDISVAILRNDQQCTLSLEVLDAKPFKRGAFMNLWYPPSFSAVDVLIETSQFLYRPSFVSPYPPSSLMANFDRLAVKSCHNVGYSSKRELPRDLLVGNNNLYCIKVDEQYVPVIPECRPYRTGSKCLVLVVLLAERNGNTFDARPAARTFRSAIDAIVEE